MVEAATDAVPWNEGERLDALVATGLLDSPGERAFDDVVALARIICNAPVALVSLVDAHRQWFKAKAGTDINETPIDTSVCALAIRQPNLFVINDLSADPRTCNFSLVTDDPKIRFYAGMPLVTSPGLPLGSLCVIDIEPRPQGLTTDQCEALEALARQTVTLIETGIELGKREEALSASFNVGTWDWDVEADRVTSDPRFAELYGVSPTVARNGAPIAEFFTRVHPDDLPLLKAQVAAALTDGAPFSSEYRIIQADGAHRWVIAQGRCMLSPDGHPLRFPGVSFDITERKSAEVRQAALLELNDRMRNLETSSDIAFAGAEILGRTLGVSRAGYGTIDPDAETITIERDWNAPGIASLAGVLNFRDYGSYIDDLNAGETVICADADKDPRTRGETAAALKAISAHSFINMPLTEQGGFVALLYLNHEKARAWSAAELVFMREVAERTRSAAERRRVEQELAELTQSLESQVEERTYELLAAEERLRQSAKMEAVGQLTGGLAHDFNNMLMGISGALELMQTRIAQGRINDLERYASAAQSASKRAAALTHRLLAFSRRQTLDPKPTDINRLVVGLEDLVRRSVGPAVNLEVVGAAGLWTTLVDPNQLENALLNLCINARDAMPEGGRITIETANKWIDTRGGKERDLEPGQYISLCVTDTGTGMSPETKARAFDPFYTTKPLGEGTGLGLSMIYGFVRQSGGQVRIYTEVGVGTTMCIYLPRHYGEADEESNAEPGAEAKLAVEGKTILVLDDEATIRMLVSELLEELGHNTLEAHDGESALRLLRSNARIDLLITDVGLPGSLNGRQVADAAQLLRPDLRVLFITGYAENAVIGNGQLDPTMQLITKPFAMDAFASKVAGLLEI